jgi:hypothetical protein
MINMSQEYLCNWCLNKTKSNDEKLLEYHLCLECYKEHKEGTD